MVSASHCVKRGEIWLINLDPTQGKEIQKTRPCVVLSPDEMNLALGIVTVAPMTTGSHAAPFRIPVTFQSSKGLILLDQMRAVDKSSLSQGTAGDVFLTPPAMDQVQGEA